MKLRSLLFCVCAGSLLLANCTPKPSGPITLAFDGTYRGNGYSASPPDWGCPTVMPADPLTVSGGQASFDDFDGWVAPNGKVQLTAQEGTIDGQFQGRSFQGLLQYHVRGSTRLGCAYNLRMEKSG
jgi:hypothetical protein